MEERIALGSGKLYLLDEPEDLSTQISDISSLIATNCIAANEFAAVKNGATLTYTPTTYTAKDDLGRFEKTKITEETATLGCGLMTIGQDVIAKLTSTARKVTVIDNIMKVTKIGGTGNDNGKNYLIIFEHKDAKDGDIYVILVGKNTAELQFQFQPGTETILNPTFTGVQMDADGTRVIFVEKAAV